LISKKVKVELHQNLFNYLLAALVGSKEMTPNLILQAQLLFQYIIHLTERSFCVLSICLIQVKTGKESLEVLAYS
jgi:hypothetical protein